MTTERLTLRPLGLVDAPLIVDLLNDPQFLEYIGDRGVRDVLGAEGYLIDGPMRMYREHGIGLLRVGLRGDDTPIGICGLLQRPYLAHPDLGFAFLPEHRRRGFGIESSRAVLEHGCHSLRLTTVLATTHRSNDASVLLLERLGFGEEVLLPEGLDPEARLFSRSCR